MAFRDTSNATLYATVEDKVTWVQRQYWWRPGELVYLPVVVFDSVHMESNVKSRTPSPKRRISQAAQPEASLLPGS